MKIDKSNKKSIRKVFGETLAMIGGLDDRIVVLDADLACSTQTKLFGDKYPDRFFDCGIAEQNMAATAAGLASEGKIPFISSFAMFATGRAFDQIRNAICYPNFNVKIVGTHCGVTVGEDGATHQALEDISIMRCIPHMTVISPADCRECEEVIRYASLHDGPMYIRISRSNVPDIFDEHYHFNIHKAVVIKEGFDISVFTHGETLAETILAAEELEKEGISVEVVHIPVIKPLDFQTVIESAKKTKFAIVVENHSIVGGLGSAICETLASRCPRKIYRIGIHDEFGQSGSAEDLLEYYGLDSNTLTKRFRTMYKKEQENL